MEKQAFDISWGSLWKIFMMFILAVALFYIRDVLVILLLAIIISSAIHEPVSYLERKKIPRLLSVLSIFIIGVALMALLLYTLVPVALIQLKYFLNNINTLKIPLLDFLGSGDLVSQAGNNLESFIDGIFYGGSSGFNLVSSLLENALFFSVVLVLSFYLALSRDGVERFIKAVFPLSKENYAIDLYLRTRKKLAKWLSGQLVISFFVGFMVFISLLVLGVEYALVLAVLAAILELVPYVGPITVGIVAFLVTIPQSLSTAFLVLIIFTIIQQIENHALVPFVMSKAIGTDPVLIVVAMLAGGAIAGLSGIILAVPVTIILQEIVEDWAERKKLTNNS
ncbi:MAG: AI-2E family transporter [Candidatus Paceibacterota bacterium]|jgi:predicted PurR-regulated permease PerM